MSPSCINSRLPVPFILLFFISCVALVWLHVVGHSSLAEAQSSHIAPVMLLSSIVTAAGILTFFFMHIGIAIAFKVLKALAYMFSTCNQSIWNDVDAPLRIFQSSPYEYYADTESDDGKMDIPEFHGEFHGEFVIQDDDTNEHANEHTRNKIVQEQNETFAKACEKHTKKGHENEAVSNTHLHWTDDEEEESMDEYENDLDHFSYASSGLVDYVHATHVPRTPAGHKSPCVSPNANHTVHQKRQILSGDILTVTMVWTNVYGLGLACFLLMPVITLASTLAVYNFLIGLNLVTLYEMWQERKGDSMYKYRQWQAGRMGARIRNALHVVALLFANVVIVLMGTHVASIHMNHIGQIKVEDVFLGIIGPLVCPILLKGVRRPHTTIVGTMELALPFCAFLACTFMISVLAMGMKPYEIQQQLSRNMVAATVILPAFFGGVIMYILHCVMQRRMLYVLCTFLVVFVGRQFTFSKQQPTVYSSLLLSALGFFIVTITSSKSIMKLLSRHR
jgi:hypothetical protein